MVERRIRLGILTTATLLLGMAGAVHSQSAASNLLTPPGQKGPGCAWMNFDGKAVSSPSLRGSQVFAFRGSPYGVNGAIQGFTVLRPPTGRKLPLMFTLRGSEPGQIFEIDAVGSNPKAEADPKVLAQATTPEEQRILKALYRVLAARSRMDRRRTRLGAMGSGQADSHGSVGGWPPGRGPCIRTTS
jgi:hypothetical protein